MWTCEKCGTEQMNDFGACWKCSEPRPLASSGKANRPRGRFHRIAGLVGCIFILGVGLLLELNTDIIGALVFFVVGFTWLCLSASEAWAKAYREALTRLLVAALWFVVGYLKCDLPLREYWKETANLLPRCEEGSADACYELAKWKKLVWTGEASRK